MKERKETDFTTYTWREQVYIETAEHIISGYIFMPKIGKQTRLITEVLNSGKSFIAVKECTLEYKHQPSKAPELHNFMQVNVSSILLMRPLNE